MTAKYCCHDVAKRMPCHDRALMMRWRLWSLPNWAYVYGGIAANPRTDEIIVGTFDAGGNNTLLRYGRSGKFAAQRDFGD